MVTRLLWLEPLQLLSCFGCDTLQPSPLPTHVPILRRGLTLQVITSKHFPELNFTAKFPLSSSDFSSIATYPN